MTAPSTSGGVCFGVRYLPNGYGGSGASVDCSGRPFARQMRMSAFVERGGVAISGQTGSAITRVIVTLQDGSRVTIRPTSGYVLALLPREIRDIVSLTGVSARGKPIVTQRWH
jgi:hypothetical protein